MLALKPAISMEASCANCGTRHSGLETWWFQGIHLLTRAECGNCHQRFYSTWPIAHGIHFPICFSETGKSQYDRAKAQWLAGPLIDSVLQKKPQPYPIEHQLIEPYRSIVIINCLDDCYGHVLWKLFNCTRHQQLSPEIGVVALIPKSFLWLVPEGLAEVWTVDAPLAAFPSGISTLDDFIRQQLARFDQVYVSKTFTHLDHSQLPLEQYVKTKPMALSDYGQKSVQFTFVLRHDRFWLSHHLDHFLWLSWIKLKKPHWLGWYFLYRQKIKVLRTVSKILKELPTASFVLVGLGTWGSFPEDIRDLRKDRLTLDEEQQWCQVYSDSQVVIGVHGSNMLIPTALAGGYINLIPRYKLPHQMEDILLRHPPRYATFLGRHLDLYASPSLVAENAVKMITAFPYLQSNTEAE